MSELLTLAERCEKSDAPDRSIDADIWFAVTPGAMRKDLVVKSDKGLWPDYTIDETRDATGRLIIVPAYTGSVDAAMRLAPDGAEWECGTAKLIGAAWAIVITIDRESKGKARTPPLALCVAALRSRGAVGTQSK